MFEVTYEDLDKQHMPWDELAQVLVGPPPRKKKKGRAARKQSTLAPPSGPPGPPGSIKKIHLENFMCHENFTMDFGPNVNWVSGHNGSGKSAALQAIQCCLGVTARKTGRGTNMTGFVRKGANQALAQVTLWNVGEDAYQHDKYGDRIVVERAIGKGGGSRFSIKDAAGKKVASTRNELEKILDHFNVLVSNPCVVMTQDHARTFLGGSVTDRNKYELFMKATMMDQVLFNLNNSKASIEKMAEILKGKVKEKNRKEKELAAWKEKLERAEELQGTVMQRDKLEGLLAWAQVHDQDLALEQARQKRDTNGPRALQAVSSKLRGHQEEHEEAMREAADAEVQVARFEEVKGLYQQRQRDAKERVAQAKKEATVAEQRLVREREMIQGLLDKQKAVEESLAESLQGKKDESAKRAIAEAERKVNELRLARRERERELSDLRAEGTAVFERATQLQRDLDELGRQRARDEATIRERKDAISRQSRGRSNGAFTEHTPLRKAVDKERRFTGPVLGPIGSYLSLKDETTAQPVEAAIGRSLATWLVSNSHDQHLLMGMAKRKNMGWLRVSKVDFGRPMYNYPDTRTGLPSIISVLRCTHPNQATIFNFLMNTEKVERIVLAPGPAEAQRAARSVHSALAYMGQGNGVMQFEAKGNSTSGRYLTRIDRPLKLAKDQSQWVASAKEDIAAKQQALSINGQRAREVEAELKSLGAEEARHDRAVEDLQGRLSGIDQGIQEAMAQQARLLRDSERDSGDDEARLNVIRANVLQASNNELRWQREHDEAKEQFELSKAHFEQQNEELELLRAKNAEILSDMTGRVERINEAKNQVAHYLDQKAKIENQIEELSRAIAERETKREEDAKAASAICEEAALPGMRESMEAAFRRVRGFDAGSTEVLEKMLRKVTNNITAAQAETGTLEELQATVEELQYEVVTRKDKLNQVVHPFRALKQSHSARLEKYHTALGDLKKQVSFNFGSYLGKKGHSGKCDFNDDDSKLALMVRMNSAVKKGTKVSDMKSLSGGERSFSTLAFTLALGRTCESPFRASDEFDVFMDAVARQVTMKTLLEFAVENRRWQFIFLTPQDISAADEILADIVAKQKLDLDKDVFMKVVQMKSQRT